MIHFISNDLLATTIIEIKDNMFGRGYTTQSELNYIRQQLQKEFNKENADIIINDAYDSFNIVINKGVITLSNNPLTNPAVSKLSDYVYIIDELIMEYAEYELQMNKEKFEKFKAENNTFEEKQKNLLKRLS